MNKSLMNIAAVILFSSSFMFGMEKKEVKQKKIKKHDREITVYNAPIVEEITVDEESQKPALPKSASESESLVVPADEQYYDATEIPGEEKQVVQEKKEDEPALYKQPIGPEVQKVEVNKPEIQTEISLWLKTRYSTSNHRTTALAYLKELFNPNDFLSKEIDSQIGRAVKEIDNTLKNIVSKSGEDINTLPQVIEQQESLIAALKEILTLSRKGAVLQKAETDNEGKVTKPAIIRLTAVAINAGMQKAADRILREHNALRIKWAALVASKNKKAMHENKAARQAIKADLHAINDHSIDENMSDDEYTTMSDLYKKITALNTKWEEDARAANK